MKLSLIYQEVKKLWPTLKLGDGRTKYGWIDGCRTDDERTDKGRTDG